MSALREPDGVWVAEPALDCPEVRVAEPDLHKVLREEMEARGWKVQQLADAVGVRFGVAARWVAEEEVKRVVPQPRTLVQIAHTFDLPVTEVFQHAGYLPSLTDQLDPDEQEIQSLTRRLRRILRAVPSPHRHVALVVTATVLDHLQLLIDRFTDIDPK